MTEQAVSPPLGFPAVGGKTWAFVRRHMLTAYALLAFAYLLVPIAVVVAFSFNNPTGRYNYTWQGFTFDQ